MKILSIALLGAGFLTPGAVAAKDYPNAKQPAKADHYYGLYQNPSQVVELPEIDFRGSPRCERSACPSIGQERQTK